jgi:hypothetical protein
MGNGPTLTPGFAYYFVAHDVWGQVSSEIGNDATHQLQYVPEGTSAVAAAGRAGSWLGEHRKRLTKLCIVGHGGPGKVHVGRWLTSDDIAPLGGWLYSFFDEDSEGIKILGCTSAADDVQYIAGYEVGQDHTKFTGLSRPGYDLLAALSKASEQIVEGALNGQLIKGLRLRSRCRRVWPNGATATFDAGG